MRAFLSAGPGVLPFMKQSLILKELGRLAQGNLRYLPTYSRLIVRKHLKTLFLNIKPISEGVSVKCFVFSRKVDVK